MATLFNNCPFFMEICTVFLLDTNEASASMCFDCWLAICIHLGLSSIFGFLVVHTCGKNDEIVLIASYIIWPAFLEF